MKKITLLLVLFAFGTTAFSQTKSGTVYSEHETIDKTREMWKAFKNGDGDAFISFFTDSIYRFINGNMAHVPRESFKNAVNYWNKSFENLEIADDKPASPDAIEYKEGGIWVQDWLLFTGTHTESGINIDVHYHNMYHFNKDGKINAIHFYYDNAVFEEINNSATTRENGVVYINHPYIVKVRKLVNAYCRKDMEGMLEYYDEKAVFSNSAMKWGETQNLEEIREVIKKDFSTLNNIKMKQVGYPDCVHYEKGDMWVVYSWWIFSADSIDGNKKMEMPMMISFYFNKDGKVVSEQDYFSTNHMEGFE